MNTKIPKKIQTFVDRCISTGRCVENELDLELPTTLAIESALRRNSDDKARRLILRLLGFEAPKGYIDTMGTLRVQLLKTIEKHKSLIYKIQNVINVLVKYHPTKYRRIVNPLNIEFKGDQILFMKTPESQTNHQEVIATIPIDFLLIPEDELISTILKERDEDMRKLEGKFEGLEWEMDYEL